MKNRFSIINQELQAFKKKTHHSNSKSRYSVRNTAYGQSKKGKCPQMSEVSVGEDPFIIDVFKFFYGEELKPHELNEELREIAAKMLWAATAASKKMDAIPRPPKGVPNPKWLVSEAVQIAFRVANNNCIYEAVRKTTAWKWKSAYEIAKQTGGAMSTSQNYFAWVHTAIRNILEGVPDVRQPSANTCWAAALTIMYSWHRKQSFEIETFLNELSDKSFLNLFNADVNSNGGGRGINKKEEQALYKILGLKLINQSNPTIETWEQYLKTYGPLGLTMAWNNGSLFHAIVVYGIEGDGTAAKTYVYVRDPAGNLPNKITFEHFLRLYENAADWPIQIIHFPEKRNSSSQSLGLVNQMSLAEIKSVIESVQFSAVPLSPTTGGRSIEQDSLNVGDIILSTTKSLPSDIIRIATDSLVSHALLYIGNGEIVEAVKEGVVRKSLKAALDGDNPNEAATLAVALRYPNLTSEQADKIKNFAMAQVGKKYDYKNVLIVQPQVQMNKRECEQKFSDPKKVRICREYIGTVDLGTDTNDKFICSELVLAAYKDAAIPLTALRPSRNSPQDIAELYLDKILEYVGHLIA